MSREITPLEDSADLLVKEEPVQAGHPGDAGTTLEEVARAPQQEEESTFV